jgi:2-polyprenyl-3-methyl-5-hydroxy-6-metoxy-1,4-benzoquinol methylase
LAFCGYNQSYLDEYIRRSQTDLGRRIIESRWDTVRCFADGGTLLDYGCATGAFHTAAPDGFLCMGWDVNPKSLYSRNFPHGHYDVLTMWDVMEHLDRPYSPLKAHSPALVFISTPNADNTSLETFGAWKHYKPVEHIHYYTPKTLAMGMAANGYTLLHYDFSEGQLRDAENPEAIFTAVFTKCPIH